MTNEEAVKMLKAKRKCLIQDVSGVYDDCNRRLCNECYLNYEQGNMGQQAEYLRMSIEALAQEPCEDAISRDELLKAIDTWDKFGCDADTKLVPYQDHYIPYIHYDDVVKCIKGMPSVTPQPKTGHWIRFKEFENGYYHIKCSECGQYWSIDGHAKIFRYCFNCGAKMTESEEKE
jgi:ribosomal protein S27E